MASPCPCCSQERDSFVCRSCLTKLLKLYKTQASSHASLLPAAQARALHSIKVADKARLLQARHYQAKSRNEAIQIRVELLGSNIEAASVQLKQRREGLGRRRERLKQVQSALRQSSTSDPPASALTAGTSTVLPALNSIKRVQHDLRSHLEELATQLVQTRQILLHEMMDAFDVVESAEMGCQFQIASLPVPPLSRLQDLPKQRLNALLSLLCLLLRLASTYLGISVPFALVGIPMKPLIRASSGTSYALRFSKPYPLYMSSGSASEQDRRPNGSSTIASARPLPPVPTSATHAQALATGLRMLAYDAYYMYQASSGSLQQDYRRKPGGAEPKNAQIADDILSLVVAMTQVECTGRFSHLAAKPEETLRSIETIPGLVDFQTYVQMTEDTAKLKNDLSVVQTQKKGRGKYVVLQQDAGPDVNAGFAAESIPNQEEEGWALV